MEGDKKNPLYSPLLACGVAAILLTPLGVFVALRSNERGPSAPEESAPAAAATAARPAARSPIPVLEEERAKPAGPRPSPMAQAPAPAKAAARTLPSAGDIPVGAEKSWLIDSFGRPSMITTEVREGRPLETFRYMRPDAGTEVVVYLSSGRVIGATSFPY